jgi:transcription-repair coupling factor (superfamily II helicase)
MKVPEITHSSKTVISMYFCAVDQLQLLLNTYRQDERTRRLADALAAPKASRISLTNLSGAQGSFVLLSTYLQQPRLNLWIARDQEEAAYIQNTIDNLLQDRPVRMLPDSFKRPAYFAEISSHQVLQRTEVVNQISTPGTVPEIIVTYPEALIEKVLQPEALQKNRISIVKGESLDMDFVLEILIEYGFEKVDFVFEPGQFSIRGGIVDIFSYGNEWPYRVELFDIEVESIRTFDPLTQLSRQRVERVNIIPDAHRGYDARQKTDLFDILPENAVIWLEDPGFILDRCQAAFEAAIAYTPDVLPGEDEKLVGFFREKPFVPPKDILEGIGRFDMVFTGKIPPSYKADLSLDFKGKPQPNFNKNFKLLIQDLRQHNSKGYTFYLFTDNPRQVERFHAIFEELEASIIFHPVIKGIHQGFIDTELKLLCYTDHQIFNRFHAYKMRRGFTRDQAINLRMLRELTPGDFVTHIDHGVGRYSGLEKIEVNGHVQESVRIIYKNNDILYVGINSLHKLARYIGKDGTEPQLSKLGSEAWKNLKAKTKKKVKDIARDLIALYARRRAAPGFAYPPDNYLQNELEASFLYEDTPDQFTATNQVKEDMEKEHPMDRLVCGDVGFGKTEVAVRAAFKAAVNGKQVAILVPTTILALQHYRTFSERLGDFGCRVDYINRFRSSADKKQILADLKEGKIDVIIGTHAILGKDIGFKDLGLLIVDEEQKFGVASKERLRSLRVNVDTLTLTATPIPRTLQFSLMSARDMSIIRTPPPNRQPIHTESRIFSEQIIRDAILYEVNRGGQVFFVHNRVKSLAEVAGLVQRLCPDVSIAFAHGQMEANTLEKTLTAFIEGQYDVLVSTNIIETGLDIPNANTMIINNAHQYGMSDLHQLRGRVGRSNTKAFCYLIHPPLSVLTPEARKRIKTIEDFSDLGSGFHIAMKDLDIRGAGNMLGAEQSGFISEIGFETFQRILDEAIQELKEEDFADTFREEHEVHRIFVREVTIDTDAEMHIPDAYVSSIQERLNLYTELDSIETEEALEAYGEMMLDRFGRLPDQVLELFDGLRLRWICKEMGFEKLVLKQQKLRAYFVTNPKSPFYDSIAFKNLLAIIASHGTALGLSVKESRHHLLVAKDGVSDLRECRRILQEVKSMQLVEL